MRVNQLNQHGAIQPVLDAHGDYQTEISETTNYQVLLPYPRVLFNDINGGVIILLPEKHDSDDPEVQRLAAAVAVAVLAIPRVKVAVEEPILYNHHLISDVGFSHPIAQKGVNTPLFTYSSDSQGSISHQIYQRQVIQGVPNTFRYAAEAMPRNPQRYNNPQINRTMAHKLTFNTRGRGEVSVFPVGPDHLSEDYDPVTLDKHLTIAGWDNLDL